jgi:nitrite reductase/ring-hydroxylating ferredoxin subunit
MTVPVNLGCPRDWRPVAPCRDGPLLESGGLPLHTVPTTDTVLVGFGPEGVPFAVAATCPHLGLPLATYGRRGAGPFVVRCAAHGYEFDLLSGACVEPGVDGNADLRLRHWPLRAGRAGTWILDLQDVAIDVQ